jgi:hypothetical protein
MNRKPIVGETLVLWTPLQRHRQERVESVIVATVGKKYFTFEGHRSRYCISDWGVEDTHNTRTNFPKWAFEHMVALNQHKTDMEIQRRFGEWLRSYPQVTVEQAKAILSIIEP